VQLGAGANAGAHFPAVTTMPNQPASERPVFVVRLRPLPDIDNPIYSLRQVLKVALRQHGMQALSCEEENHATTSSSDQP
jgi:hypothetical protein